jgi:hypothetical protein
VISTGLRGRDRPTASSIVSKICAYWFESCPLIVSAGLSGCDEIDGKRHHRMLVASYLGPWNGVVVRPLTVRPLKAAVSRQRIETRA